MFNNYYELYDSFILRTPANSINSFKKLETLTNSTIFDESIYLASREFYSSIKKDKIDCKHLETKLKYAYRSIVNPTPFGLFSCCNIGEFAQTSMFKTEGEQIRTTFLDNSILDRIVSLIIDSEYLSKSLKFYSNNTIYYDNLTTKYYVTEKDSKFYLNSFKKSEVIDRMLNSLNNGMSKKELMSLFSEQIDYGASSRLINQLISHGVILPDLLLDLSAKNGFKTILGYLKKHYSSSSLYKDLLKINSELTLIDKNTTENNFIHYTKIENILKSYFFVKDTDRIFNVNSSKNLEKNTLNSKIKDEIIECLELISKFHLPIHNEFVSGVKQEFFLRYKSKRIKLQSLFDHDTGLDILTNKNIDDEFIKPFISNNSNNKISENVPDIYKHLKEMLKRHSKEKIVKLFKKDFSSFRSNYHFSETFSVMVEIYLIENRRMYYFDFVGGSTSSNFISRFSNYDREIENFVKKIFKDEQTLNKDMSEVKFVGNSRSINVLKSKAQRNREVLLSGKKENTRENTLYLNDLFLTLENEEFVLTDQEGDRVMPKLSTADNFENSNNDIYRFLGELQYQSIIRSCEFDERYIPNEQIYQPRVEIGNIILVKAKWSLTINEFVKFKTRKEHFEKFKEWILFLNIKSLVSVKDKTPIIFDLSSEENLNRLYNFLIKYKKLLLTEYLGEFSISIIDNATFHNEFIFFLKKKN